MNRTKYTEFLDRVLDNLKSVGIDVSDMTIDHIAYRSTTEKSFIQKTGEMLSLGKRASRMFFRKRYVDMYLLDRPLEYKGQKIRYFEVLAPATGDTFAEGLEHAEYVVDENLLTFIDRYPGLKWNTNAINRKIGADVGIKFENGANAKFKNQTMEEIIRLEKEEGERVDKGVLD